MRKKLCQCLFCWAPRTEAGEDAIYGVVDALTDSPSIAVAALKTGQSRRLVLEVSRRLNRPKTVWGPQLRPNAYGADTRAKVGKMLDDDCSYTEISRTLGMSRSTISNWFPGRGFTKEQHAERSRLNLLELRLTGALRPERIAA